MKVLGSHKNYIKKLEERKQSEVRATGISELEFAKKRQEFELADEALGLSLKT